MNRILLCQYGWVVLLALCLLPSPDAVAQPAGRRFGIGGQIGDPSGLTLKMYRPGRYVSSIFRPRVVTLLASWDFDDSFFLNVHTLDERLIPESPLRYFIGPGILIGFRGRRHRTDLLAGITGSFGVNFFRDRFEVHLQVTPRLLFFPDVTGDFDAGVGLRYYF